MSDLVLTCRQSIDYALKDANRFKKKKNRNHVGNYIFQSAELFSIKFDLNLVSEVCFLWKLKENDSMITAIFDADGNFVESYFGEA